MRSEGYSTWSVCLSVTTISATTHDKPGENGTNGFSATLA